MGFGFWKNKRIVLFDTLLQITVGLTKEKGEDALGFEYTVTDGGVKVGGLKGEQTVAGKWNEVHTGRNDELKEGTIIVKVNTESLESLSKLPKEELEKLSDTDKVVEGLKALSEPSATGTLTLILETKPYTDDEILAILCHEIGHWFHAHVLRMLVLSSVHIFVLFRLYAFVMYSSSLFQSFGFSAEERSVMVGLSLFSFMFTPVETCWLWYDGDDPNERVPGRRLCGEDEACGSSWYRLADALHREPR